MRSTDILGPKGRAALRSCVKVMIMGKPTCRRYSVIDAQRRVMKCYGESFPGNIEIFPVVRNDDDEVDFHATYDINDIQQAITRIDREGQVSIHLSQATRVFNDAEDKESFNKMQEANKENVDEERQAIQTEFQEANTDSEFEHGCGFIISDHFILTNAHVIETADADQNYQIQIGNQTIGTPPCRIVYVDIPKDLALLYCADLNLASLGVQALTLVDEELLPGMSVFSFGYPMNHTGNTALFVNGYVSGEKRTFNGDSLAVLNCPLNSGNSGGPILCWIDDTTLCGAGVACQKHIKAILNIEEMQTIEKIRESMQTDTISDAQSHIGSLRAIGAGDPRRKALDLLTLKLYDALATHTQFNLSNTIPSRLVFSFLQDCVNHASEHSNELTALLPRTTSQSSTSASGHRMSLMSGTSNSSNHQTTTSETKDSKGKRGQGINLGY